jgi:hypothetical protein
VLSRNISFDRYTLQITRQRAFDTSGGVVCDAAYSDWKDHGGVSFPSEIDIRRPMENYQVQLNLVSIKVNTPDVTDEKFVLEQPVGYQLQILK